MPWASNAEQVSDVAATAQAQMKKFWGAGVLKAYTSRRAARFSSTCPVEVPFIRAPCILGAAIARRVLTAAAPGRSAMTPETASDKLHLAV
jgi:hypothetical protein